MIINLEDQTDLVEFGADVCIIGAGPAGISLALKLSKLGKIVALIEGGGLEYSENSQAMYEGRVVGDPYFDLKNARLRYLGGTSGHWGGWCRFFDKEDFQRGNIHSALEWPISRDELLPFQGEACSILELKEPKENLLINQEFGIQQIFWQFSPPVRFGKKYSEKIKNSDNIRLYINSNLIKIEAHSGRVDSALFKTFSGKRLKIKAKNFVFAMGGIENSRQLIWQQMLNNMTLYPNNLPVGKYWMEHPHFTVGSAMLNADFFLNEKRIFFSMNSQAQKELGVMGVGIRVEKSSFKESEKTLNDLMCAAPKIGMHMAKAFNQGLYCGASVRAAWEQLPVEKNKIVLSKHKKDFFGVPLPELVWGKTDFDRQTIIKSIRHFGEYLANKNLGRLKISDWLVNNEEYPLNDERAGFHHMGGTRMSHDTKYRVVDENCKVIGVDNLYVAGSSVFTTGGHNNPTMPIVMLSLRLAEHISKKI